MPLDVLSQRAAEVEAPTAHLGLERLLGVQEAAELLGISARTVFRLASLPRNHADRLRTVRIGNRVLFRPADLERYVQGHLT